ncbi:MAG: hypothetical protein R2746_08815 [Acidimicrobiales bacterium]
MASYVTGGENSGMLEALLSAEDSDDAGRAIGTPRPSWATPTCW